MRTTSRRITGANSQVLIGRALEWLRARGWSAGEARMHADDGSPFWKVEATDDSGQSVIASATTQSGAWEIACRKIGRISKDS